MTAALEPGLWRPSPARLAQLVAGLCLFGVGEACIVHAQLGNAPWTVLAQGVAGHTPLSVGTATIVISSAVLLAWVPLGVRPGLGTLLNAVLIGVVLDRALPLLEPLDGLATRIALVPAGILLVSAGSGLYLTTRLGPGARDGLMGGLHRRTGRSLRLWRTLLEGTALVAGFALGGVVGAGTVVYALLIGPGVQAAVHRLQRLDLDQPPRPA